MKWLSSLTLATALVANGSMVHAQGVDKSDEMWARFYEKLTAVIKQGNKDPSMVVSLCVPGTPLVDLKQSEVNDVSYVNELLAMAPTFNTVWTPSNIAISDIYKKILDQHVNLPVAPLTAEEQQQLATAQAYLDAQLPIFETWEMRLAVAAEQVAMEKMDDFAKKKGVGQFSASAKATQTLKSMERAYKGDSKSQFTAEGETPLAGGEALKVISALDTVRALQSRNPAAWWSSLSEKFNKGQINDTYMVSTFPPLDQWADDKGWVKFSYQASDKVDTSSLSTQDIAASLSVRYGALKVNGEFSKSDSLSQAMSSDNSLKITMEMKRVYFRRPWLDAAVFANQKWQWAPSTGVLISDGSGKGVLPMLPGSLIIVRKVKFESKALEDSSVISENSLSGALSISAGPFSASGSYSKKNKSAKVTAKKVKGGIEIPDPQIIGYVSTILPQCPDPKP